ncbi:MAG: hypothetical protein LBH50_00140 [Spirochaetaceae bacterium]|jgi:hypothetical protein|nr:hypothetical protein [Spirochaetaceae bacterium]
MNSIKIYTHRCIFVLLFLLNSALYAERIRIQVKDVIEVSSAEPLGISSTLSYNDSALILLQRDTRFIRGVELELTAPQSWLPHSGSVAFSVYSNLDRVPPLGQADVECTSLLYEPIPDKIQTVYQIPLRDRHGLRGTPYLKLLNTPVAPESFPLIFRLTPNMKGWSKEIEDMRFQLTVKPVFSDEGALLINVRRPDFLPNGSFTALIDDQAVKNPNEEILLKEGEHTLTLISSDYRTENRRFIIERGTSLQLSVNLHDLTPLVIFEAPENARIFIDNSPVVPTNAPLAVDPGEHTFRVQVSDYSVVKTLVIEKGKTYRIAFIVDMRIAEE